MGSCNLVSGFVQHTWFTLKITHLSTWIQSVTCYLPIVAFFALYFVHRWWTQTTLVERVDMDFGTLFSSQVSWGLRLLSQAWHKTHATYVMIVTGSRDAGRMFFFSSSKFLALNSHISFPVEEEEKPPKNWMEKVCRILIWWFVPFKRYSFYLPFCYCTDWNYDRFQLNNL